MEKGLFNPIGGCSLPVKGYIWGIRGWQDCGNFLWIKQRGFTGLLSGFHRWGLDGNLLPDMGGDKGKGKRLFSTEQPGFPQFPATYPQKEVDEAENSPPK